MWVRLGDRSSTRSLPASCARARASDAPPAELPGDEQGADPAGQIDRELEHVGPHHGLEAAEPGVDHGDDAHHHDRRRHAPAGHQRERDGAGEDPDGVAQEAGDQEDERGEPPGADAEARLEPGVGGLLLAPEVAGEEPARHADAADEVAEGELEKRQVAAGADARDGDDRERRGLGGDDGEQDGPGRQVARAEEVVGRAALVARDPEADAQREDEVQHDDGEVESVHGRWRG